MSYLLGHALPGSFFLIWALHQTYAIARLHLQQQQRFRTRLSLPLFGSQARDTTVKLLATTIGFIGELATSFDPIDGSMHTSNMHHMTVFALFFLYAIAEWHASKNDDESIMPNLDYPALCLAFSAEAVLFHYHLHGRDPINVALHQLLFLAAVFCAFTIFAEALQRKSLMAALVRCYAMLLHGVWLWAIGFALVYWPRGNAADDAHHVMLVALAFVWCAAACLPVVAAVLWLAWYCNNGNEKKGCQWRRVASGEEDSEELLSSAAAEAHKVSRA